MRRLRETTTGEEGLTLIEVVWTVFLVVVGLGAIIATFSLPHRQSFSAQRLALASSVAQSELNQLANRSYSDICTTSTGLNTGSVTSANPTNPDSFVSTGSGSGKTFQILSSYKNIPLSGGSYSTSSLVVPGTPTGGEVLVTGNTGSGSPNCVPATSTSLPTGTTGTIYRFVTYANESCDPTLPASLNSLLNPVLSGLAGLLNKLTSKISGGLNLFCSTPNNMKRITVAVALTPPGNGAGPSLPVYMSTLVPNPNAGIFGGTTGSGITVTCTVAVLLTVSCS
jgi:hypothetical protein